MFPWVVPAAAPTRQVPIRLSLEVEFEDETLVMFRLPICLYVKCYATHSRSEKKVVTRCDPTMSWSAHRSAGNLGAVEIQRGRNPVLAVNQPRPASPGEAQS